MRAWLTGLLTDEAERDLVEPHLVPRRRGDPADAVRGRGLRRLLLLAATTPPTSGKIFRPDDEPLKPNWRHLPVGYHGRAGTVVVSGTDVRRPSGQRAAGRRRPDLRPQHAGSTSRPRWASWWARRRRIGDRVATDGFADHVFGLTLLNDWSARDIQAWEYVPLGPFLGKSFSTSVSGWVTPLDALAAARVDLPGQDPEPLDYLRVGAGAGFDIDLEVLLNGETVSRPPYSSMYWSPAQMLAHLTVNGASLRTGDLFASGTVSGPEQDQRGSFLELSWGGTEPFARRPDLPAGRRHGDPARHRARRQTAAASAFGEVTGTVTPALA